LIVNILQLENVTKRYARQIAVDCVSLSVRRGIIFGLLGPNGAGKTSTIRMITGITLPDSGRIELFGEPQQPPHQNKVGYMPEERGLYRKLEVRKQLEYLGSLRGMDSASLKRSIDYWFERFEIGSWAKKKTNELSKGMQQKLQFIVTVLHDPELLILDEPVSGLDPINAELINEIILELRAKGKSILLSTHRMEQVEQLCDEIALMNQGKIVLSGTLRDVKRASGKRMVRIVHHGSSDLRSTLSSFDIRVAEHHTNELLIELLGKTESQPILMHLAGVVDIIKWEIVEPPLKEIFLEAVATPIRKEEIAL
jgi:ABC-2 type transport system ATP-binding protein